ncbi:LysM peptidoglycan-binding domain-containing protein [Flavobacterium franklandianum]|uniref:LysM peptidoglycan-binding domain-containing protein n=1 Tax=Flavobacterium franklandianum TaxID=2594430 RepID=A0A553CTG7_9FLAO|nr:LysM peptidoglycan-binding domain-containing protein [Flavobacterium franklandianum]TRX23694.1 LysM peptidoglycan-binding domain-containing protein [Flavobacterium franklandianum]TRX27008.1 LysM peptidoglycan-binding domain-containing protein [Flavobacterium franklandianum]
MKIKNIAPLLFLFFSIQSFSQKYTENKTITKTETQNFYLDSIKKTFVKDDLASCVDSLWLKELTNLDLFAAISDDIKNINIDEKVDYELPTELLKQRLAEMDAKSPFNIEYNPGLENIIKSFLKNRKKSFGRLMAISEYYFPMFEEALAKQNVPLEIKYLAIVESALNPKAVSRMGATGLWQFMYQTGKQYNLKIDSYVDERSDPLKSSEAAAQYMSKMYGIFGDWDLVLASYNSGPGNVAKAIRRSGGQQNYWNIRKNLPKETQGYVPAFLATMYIYEYHNEHGIKPERALVQHFATDTIMIKKQMSFKQISDLLNVPVAQLQLLNPSYKMNVIPVYGDQDHFLRLPKEKISVFVSNEDKIYAYLQRDLDFREKPFQVQKAIVLNDTMNYSTQRVTHPKTKYYTVKRGDNLSEIADKYSVTVSDIKKWNRLKGSMLTSGKSLKIISNESVVQTVKKESKSNDVSVDIKTDTLSTSVASLYVVQKGDNLSSIAKKNNVSVAEIKEWNHLSNAPIQLGMSLQVTQKEVNEKEIIASTTKTENVEYIVKKGDNLGNIAKKFGSSVDDLKQWNILENNTIAMGSSLIVAKSEVAIENNGVANTFSKKESLAATSKSKSNNYLVKKGDSLYSISKKYPGVSISDIEKWNDIKGKELKPGMKLKING